jgi:hypothetical protein
MSDVPEGARWRKPRRSFSNGNCVELADWRKSSRSVSDGHCAEVGRGPAVVGVRDTKLESSPVLVFGGEAWAAFTSRLKMTARAAPLAAGQMTPCP